MNSTLPLFNHPSSRSRRIGAGPSTSVVKPTVLVCEDEYFIVAEIRHHLQEAGYRVIEAKDADHAQALFLSGEPIDLLTTDIMVPGRLGGLDLAQWVRETHPAVQIMVITGWAHHERAGRCFDAFLMKPYSVEDLVRQIKNLVPLRR